MARIIYLYHLLHSMSSDWRTVLGYQDGNSRNTVAAKYRKMMLKYHPNKSGTQNTRAEFARAREAWTAAQAHFQSPTPSFQRPSSSPTPVHHRPSPPARQPTTYAYSFGSIPYSRTRVSSPAFRRPRSAYSYSAGSIPFAQTRIGRPSPSAYHRPSPPFAQSPPPSPRRFGSRFRRWFSRHYGYY